MDRVLNSRDEKQTVYEIYRACRLCGAGAGYKMPIIQNVIELDGDGIELRQKIKECVQIEVSHTDRMPPLICELCVEKVNEFYEFLDMCKQNNQRTRLRLGLPLNTPTRDSVDSENCILGVTEPMFVDSDAEPLKQKSKKTKVKKEPEVKIKTERRPSPPASRGVSPAATARARRSTRSSEQVHTQIEKPVPRRPTRQHHEPEITPIEIVTENKLKRPRDKDAPIEILPPKKAKTIPEPLKIPNRKIPPKDPFKPTKQPKIRTPPKTTPKSPPRLPNRKLLSKLQNPRTQNSKLLAKLQNSKVNSKSEMKVPETKFICIVCNLQTKTSNGLAQHCASKHVPLFTNPKNACNACELWFPAAEECAAHHRQHLSHEEPYKCTRCYGYFKLQQEYDEHFGLGQCLSEWEVPDVICPACSASFPTARLLDTHLARCTGGKCAKCNRSYAQLKNLLKHESACTKRADVVKIFEDARPGLLPMEVRITRCDSLLAHGGTVHCGALPQNFGLDRSRQYPYFRTRVKAEPIPMVAIHSTIKEEYPNTVSTLSTLCLRIVQTDKTLKEEPDFDISSQIDSIIDHLTNDDQISCESDSILNDNTDDVELGEVAEYKELESKETDTVKEIELIVESREGVDEVLNEKSVDYLKDTEKVREVELTVASKEGVDKVLIEECEMDKVKEVELTVASKEGEDKVLIEECEMDKVKEVELTVASKEGEDKVLIEECEMDKVKEVELTVASKGVDKVLIKECEMDKVKEVELTVASKEGEDKVLIEECEMDKVKEVELTVASKEGVDEVLIEECEMDKVKEVELIVASKEGVDKVLIEECEMDKVKEVELPVASYESVTDEVVNKESVDSIKEMEIVKEIKLTVESYESIDKVINEESFDSVKEIGKEKEFKLTVESNNGSDEVINET